jgi:hypothetical protein
VDEDQRSARLNDQESEEDVEAHMRKGRDAAEEARDETESDDDFELHMKRGRD